MLNSSNYDLVQDRIEEFKQFLQEFKEAHAAYHSQLRDENEIKHDFKSVLRTLESLFTTLVLFHAVIALCKFP